MGLPVQLFRTPAGQQLLRASQQRRFPAWREGVALAQSILEDPTHREWCRSVLETVKDQQPVHHHPHSSSSSSSRWCLFSSDAVASIFTGDFEADSPATAAHRVSQSSAADQQIDASGSSGGIGAAGGGAVGATATTTTTCPHEPWPPAAKSAFVLWQFLEVLARHLQLFYAREPNAAKTKASNGSSKKKKPRSNKGDGQQAEMQTLHSRELSIEAVLALHNAARSRDDAETVVAVKEAEKMLSNAYQVVLLEVLIAVDEACRRTTAAVDLARQQLNQFSQSMRDKALRALVTPAQKTANKALKVQEAALKKLVEAQVSCRDNLLDHVGNIVVAVTTPDSGRLFGLRNLIDKYGAPLTQEEIVFRITPQLASRQHPGLGERPESGQALQLAHHTLLDMIGGLETRNAALISSKRAYFLCGPAVFLSQALINYSLNYLLDDGCNIVQPPEIMAASMMSRVAQLDDFDDNLYHVARGHERGKDGTATGGSISTDSRHYLIATAEQPLCAMHYKQVFSYDSLPRDIGGVSTCFRTEAGSQAIDTKGIFRVHQFEKVEQVTVTTPSRSELDLGRLLSRTMHFYETLGLPFQLVRCPCEELTPSAAVKYDIEAWFPAQGQFREVVSCSSCTDFQSRALAMRMERECVASTTTTDEASHSNGPNVDELTTGKRSTVPHLLNSTLMANTRTISAILENYASSEGIVVPSVLRPFMPRKFREIIRFVKPPAADAASTALDFARAHHEKALPQSWWFRTPNGEWKVSSEDTPAQQHCTATGSTVNTSATCVVGTKGNLPGAADGVADEERQALVHTQSGAPRGVENPKYRLLLRCVHQKGVQFRTAPSLDCVYRGKGPKGAKSGSVVVARRHGSDGQWFATGHVPVSSEGPHGASGDPFNPQLFTVHPHLEPQQELWLPALSVTGLENFVIESDRIDDAAEPHATHVSPSGEAGVPYQVGHLQCEVEAGDVDFEHDPARDAVQRSDRSPSEANPDSWGLGVLYEERRVDGEEAFTRQEFFDFYGGFAEWDAAAPLVEED